MWHLFNMEKRNKCSLDQSELHWWVEAQLPYLPYILPYLRVQVLVPTELPCIYIRQGSISQMSSVPGLLASKSPGVSSASFEMEHSNDLASNKDNINYSVCVCVCVSMCVQANRPISAVITRCAVAEARALGHMLTFLLMHKNWDQKKGDNIWTQASPKGIRWKGRVWTASGSLSRPGEWPIHLF